MKHPTSRRSMSGFTLIEVLLAMAITAVVMATVTLTFRLTLEARETVDSLAESTEAGPRTLNLIERDLRGLWTFNIKNNAVLRGRSMDVNSFEADRIDLLTTTDSVGFVLDGMNRQHRTTLCEVGYWLKQNPRYRDLIELWRREDPMVDQDLITDGSFQLVYDRIKSFKITYYKTLGAEAEELHEWDSSIDDELPRRIKIEFTLERQRGSRNVVNDAEVEDLEGAEKTYTRHIVFDRRYPEILRAGIAMVPVLPPPPQDPANQQGAGPAGGPTAQAGGKGPGGALGPGQSIVADGRGPNNRDGRTRSVQGQGAAGRMPGGAQGVPPGFNLGDLLRGGGNAGNIFGGNNGGGGGRR